MRITGSLKCAPKIGGCEGEILKGLHAVAIAPGNSNVPRPGAKGSMRFFLAEACLAPPDGVDRYYGVSETGLV